MRIHTGLLTVLICWGCTTGPGTLVSRSSEDATTHSSPHSKSSESGVMQVAALELEDRESGFQSTPSGLKYRILQEGKGRRPNKNSTVTCHYRGWLDDGQEFDSSYKRGNAATFRLGEVVKGWTEGLQLIQEGGKIELEIPYELGYGKSGKPPIIPPEATLHFEVELLKVR